MISYDFLGNPPPVQKLEGKRSMTARQGNPK